MELLEGTALIQLKALDEDCHIAFQEAIPIHTAASNVRILLRAPWSALGIILYILAISVPIDFFKFSAIGFYWVYLNKFKQRVFRKTRAE